jgi:hypothetical protein
MNLARARVARSHVTDLNWNQRQLLLDYTLTPQDVVVDLDRIRRMDCIPEHETAVYNNVRVIWVAASPHGVGFIAVDLLDIDEGPFVDETAKAQ